jgi:tetrahydromethanopterin S-methyltransferase subunit H
MNTRKLKRIEKGLRKHAEQCGLPKELVDEAVSTAMKSLKEHIRKKNKK